MHFRGTLDEFENHFLLIKLQTTAKTVMKSVSLRGISQILYLKSTIKLYDAKDFNKDNNFFFKLSGSKPADNKDKEQPILKNEALDDEEKMNDQALDFFDDERRSMIDDPEKDEEDEEEDDELLQEDKNMIYITVEGRVNLNKMPRFKQKGELIRFKKNERYLIVLINRVESVMAPDDRNGIDCFVSVNWGGNEKFTQTFYDSNQPDFNEVSFLFFYCFC